MMKLRACRVNDVKCIEKTRFFLNEKKIINDTEPKEDKIYKCRSLSFLQSKSEVAKLEFGGMGSWRRQKATTQTKPQNQSE